MNLRWYDLIKIVLVALVLEVTARLPRRLGDALSAIIFFPWTFPQDFSNWRHRRQIQRQLTEFDHAFLDAFSIRN